MKASANPLALPEDMTRASEYAVLMSAAVGELPERTARQLRDLLSALLAEAQPARRREARLGLLVELFQLGQRLEPVVESEYERTRAARAAEGEAWPAATQVAAAYGGWDKACDAAMRLALGGTSSRVPADYSHGKFKGSCTHLTLADALIRCHAHFGDWAYESQYHAWAGQCRRLARVHGSRDPNLPGPKQIERLAGDFERATELAKRELARRTEMPSRALP